MQNTEQENQEELNCCYSSENEMMMTEDIENLLNDWLNEFEEQQEDTTSKFP